MTEQMKTPIYNPNKHQTQPPLLEIKSLKKKYWTLILKQPSLVNLRKSLINDYVENNDWDGLMDFVEDHCY